jgi:hypothetical protein
VTVNGGLALLGVFNGSGNFTDEDFATDGANAFTATVNYGDGSGTFPLPLNGATFTLAHTYHALLTPFTITVTVTDSEGMSGTGTTTLLG